MKAEHRKELQTNILADRMGRFVQDIKSSHHGRSAAIVVIAVVAIATLIGWQWSMSLSGRTSELWLKLDEDELLRTARQDEPREMAHQLNGIAELAPASLPARTARFQEARLLMSAGMLNLYGHRHIEAAMDLEQARQIYTKLVDQCRGESILQQEALMGVAQTEEALVGVPDGEDAKKALGSMDKALAAYRTLATKYPDGYLGQQAAARLKKIDEDPKAVEKFYAALRKQATETKPLFGVPSGHP